MNTEILQEIGLNQTQAKAYLALIKNGKLTPPQLARQIKETRTNAYKVLDQLADLGLIKKIEENKKITYWPENPVVLEKLAKDKRDQAMAQERQVQSSMPALLNLFHTFSEQPGIRFFMGEDGINEIFKDVLRTKQTLYLVRSPADIEFYDHAFFANYIRKKVRLGIETIAITPDVISANHNPEIDRANKFTRTWIPKEAYTAPVEWNIYGDKVAFMSYGQEAIGMIIESPQIANSFKQIFKLLQGSPAQS